MLPQFSMILCTYQYKSAFSEISAVFVSKIDNVNKFALLSTLVMKCDLQKECLFRTCSVVTKLVTSFEFKSDFVL